MSNLSWQDVALALIASLPATIAAVSSIVNGRKIDDSHSAGEDGRARLARSVSDLKERVAHASKLGRN